MDKVGPTWENLNKLGSKYDKPSFIIKIITINLGPTSDAVRCADSGVNIGDRPEADGIASLRCFPRDFFWIRDRDLLGEGDASAAAAADAAITEALLLPGFLEMLPVYDGLRDLTF